MTLEGQIYDHNQNNCLGELANNSDMEILYNCHSEFSTGGHAPFLEVEDDHG